VAELCNRFLTLKAELVDAGELASRTFQRYHANCAVIVDVFGRQCAAKNRGPEDFQRLRSHMGKRWGPVALANEIQMVRSVFRYGYEAGLIDRPVRFGPGFRKPSAKVLRLNRAKNGLRLWEPMEIRKVLHHASPNMHAMILLGINGGLGNTDVGLLPITAVDLTRGRLSYPRPKTGILRRIPLWPETASSIRVVLKTRTEPKNPGDEHLLFIGLRGQSYVGRQRGYRVVQEFDRLKAVAGVTGRTFYDLRRTFETIGEDAHDLVAVRSIMGHAPASGDMSALYRQRIDDARLVAVVEHVRGWLFAEGS